MLPKAGEANVRTLFGVGASDKFTGIINCAKEVFESLPVLVGFVVS